MKLRGFPTLDSKQLSDQIAPIEVTGLHRETRFRRKVRSVGIPGAVDRFVKKYIVPAVFSMLVCSILLKSQQPLVGLIQGTIVDQKHAAVPYALLTATNVDSVEPDSHTRTTNADERGLYQFVDVPEGRYSIVVQKKGYRDYTIAMVSVRGGETVNMPEIEMSPATPDQPSAHSSRG